MLEKSITLYRLKDASGMAFMNSSLHIAIYLIFLSSII